MELDFTWMTSIKDEKAKRDFNPALAKNRPSEQASEPRKADTEYKLPSVQQKPTQSRVEPVAGLKRLQEKEEAIKRDHEQSVQVYREYQKNIKLTDSTQAEILKGLRTGEDPVGLLLKAIEAISLMTGNKHFYTQARGDLISIYGEALLYPLPLQWQIDEGMERMGKMLEALSREQDPTSRERIEASLKTLYQKIEKQQALLEEAQAHPPQLPEKVHTPIAV